MFGEFEGRSKFSSGSFCRRHAGLENFWSRAGHTESADGRNPAPWETAVCWYFQADRIIPWFLRWCEMDLVHPQVPKSDQLGVVRVSGGF